MGDKSAEVVLSDTTNGVAGAIREVFSRFGGGGALLRGNGDVYIKPNVIDLKKYCYTDPEVLRETIKYFRACGARKVYVIENCTQASFTRLVYSATGVLDVCRETGAVPIYLDETESVPIFLDGIEGFIEISRFVYERLIEKRDKNLYISLPKLKTHSMTQVTLTIKNQFGLVHQKSRIADHNYRLHRKFADIYSVIRPDFGLVDGLIATNHGHYMAEGNAEKCVVPMNLLAGGPDPLALDVVCSALMGFGLNDVPHLAGCAETGIGVSDLNEISIVNRHLFEERKKKLTCELLDDFPEDLRIIRGKERCCREGCRLNTENVIEILHRDHGGKGGFTILMGKGIDRGEVGRLDGRVHIAGWCAAQEHQTSLERRLGKKNITVSPGCNNLALTVAGLCKHMGVSPLKLIPVSPPKALMLLITAKLKGTKANITPLL
jgi:uncharacterized protein (DUF362 family)